MSLLSGLFEHQQSHPPIVGGIRRAPLVLAKPIEQPAPGPDSEPQHFTRTAATASPEWLLVRNQHINHLMACRACYAPTGRYCAAGAELCQHYEQTPMEHTQ